MGSDGENLKFKRETLLNYGMNRWGLNKAQSVGKTSELIRKCAPSSFEEWKSYYFNNATQKKRNGIKITREFIRDLGQKLYSVKSGKKKKIFNVEVIEEIRKEIETLKKD